MNKNLNNSKTKILNEITIHILDILYKTYDSNF